MSMSCVTNTTNYLMECHGFIKDSLIGFLFMRYPAFFISIHYLSLLISQQCFEAKHKKAKLSLIRNVPLTSLHIDFHRSVSEKRHPVTFNAKTLHSHCPKSMHLEMRVYGIWKSALSYNSRQNPKLYTQNYVGLALGESIVSTGHTYCAEWLITAPVFNRQNPFQNPMFCRVQGQM